MVNFKSRLNEKRLEKKVNPIEIYDTLDRKSITGPLRSAQEYILCEWYKSKKDDRDLIIKLHTGEGKTLIGLLILLSRINMGEGPCLYVCPNRYLVKQVQEEAEKFGIQHEVLLDGNELSDDFIAGQKILITHAQKVFNGKSIFGIGSKSIDINSIILDDSHTCIDVIKKSFTITITRDESKIYDNIFKLFEDDLRKQGEGSFLEVCDGDYSTLMVVPYWSWYDKKSELLAILSDNRDNNCIKFCWDLIKNSIENYVCFVTGNKIEISPYNINVKDFGVFANATHRTLMSATTQDDSFFIKGLGFSIESVENPLKNDKQIWAGEKMIILPSLIDDSLDRNRLITYLTSKKITKFGVVSIVPNTKKAEHYKVLGGIVTNSTNIFNEIDKLKKRNFSRIVVLNNRYDGIDLPDEACRLLIIDSKPYFENLSDQYEELCRPNSDIVNKKLAQKIEQGLGRSVRGEKDYCVILVIGNDIVKFMRSQRTKKYFSLQTRKQIDIGLEISELARNDITPDSDPMNAILGLIKQSLSRDEDWKAFYSSEMDSINDNNSILNTYDILKSEKEIEETFSYGDYNNAYELAQMFIDKHSEMNDFDKGWYMQQLARYCYFIDKSKFDKLQQSAFKFNNQLLKPKNGVIYSKVSYINGTRMKNIKKFLNSFETYEELTLAMNETLDNLSFGINSDKFEESMKNIGLLLGFESQRPDKEIGKGPDNLWCDVNNQYLMFECKNEVDENRKYIKKSEVGQVNNHCGWFEKEYGKNIQVYRYVIIPTKTLEYAANFTHEVRIIRKGNLRRFKNMVNEFIKALSPYQLNNITEEKLQELVDTLDLNSNRIRNDFSEEYYQK